MQQGFTDQSPQQRPRGAKSTHERPNFQQRLGCRFGPEMARKFRPCKVSEARGWLTSKEARVCAPLSRARACTKPVVFASSWDVLSMCMYTTWGGTGWQGLCANLMLAAWLVGY
jgi:hypothetical protein